MANGPWPRVLAGLGAALVGLLAGQQASLADVLSSDTNRFTVENSEQVSASPDDVWEALVGKVGFWWSAAHTYSGDSANLSIEAVPGGCFCERWDDGGALHLTVVNADRGRLLRLIPAGVDGWATAVDGVLAEQLQRLKSYVETGSPE